MISLVEADKRGPNGVKNEFYGFKKSRKRSTFFYSYSKDSAFTAVKGIQSYKQGMREGYHFSIEGIRKGPSTFSVKNGI